MIELLRGHGFEVRVGSRVLVRSVFTEAWVDCSDWSEGQVLSFMGY